MAAAIRTTLALSHADHEKAALLAQARREAAARKERLRAEQKLHIWRLYHEEGLSAPEIARQMHTALLARGVEPAEADRLAPSHDKVRFIVGSRTRPARRPEVP